MAKSGSGKDADWEKRAWASFLCQICRQIMAERGMMWQEDFAEWLGLHPSTVSNHLTGKRLPKPKIMGLVANKLGISFEEIESRFREYMVAIQDEPADQSDVEDTEVLIRDMEKRRKELIAAGDRYMQVVERFLISRKRIAPV